MIEPCAQALKWLNSELLSSKMIEPWALRLWNDWLLSSSALKWLKWSRFYCTRFIVGPLNYSLRPCQDFLAPYIICQLYCWHFYSSKWCPFCRGWSFFRLRSFLQPFFFFWNCFFPFPWINRSWHIVLLFFFSFFFLFFLFPFFSFFFLFFFLFFPFFFFLMFVSVYWGPP